MQIRQLSRLADRTSRAMLLISFRTMCLCVKDQLLKFELTLRIGWLCLFLYVICQTRHLYIYPLRSLAYHGIGSGKGRLQF